MWSVDRKLKDCKKSSDDINGQCAKCGQDVWEALCILDDAYNVWTGECPHCQALNYLSTNHGLRGYSSAGMHLVLPTDEEIKANELHRDTPSQGSKGPATMHGSPLGEIVHRLSKQENDNGKEM